MEDGLRDHYKTRVARKTAVHSYSTVVIFKHYTIYFFKTHTRVHTICSNY